LNWENSLALAEEAKLQRKALANKKRKRSRISAITLLILAGYAGFHRFYVYDSKLGWRMFCIYCAVAILMSMLALSDNSTIFDFRSIIFIVYWALIILVSYKKLINDVELINREVEKYE